VTHDLQVLNQTEDEFKFFLTFAHEIMDRYGRLLYYINRYQEKANYPEPRPKSYNERLLKVGKVNPYFIWPNIDPFKGKTSLKDAVIPPKKPNDTAESNPVLSSARQEVRDARQNQIGIFDAEDPLKLQPFEVRFLARKSPPNRWVIDLGKNDDVLLNPQEYYTIGNIEDRLYIPEEYVPLFIEAVWKLQS
jgi:hypothetical protein